MHNQHSKTLPGDVTARQRLERAIRVDHAGEYGAMRIYAGQLAVLGKGASGAAIRHMQQQEAEHLAAFETLMRERKVRPTALMPIWHVMGYALGAGTALLGEKAAMACTVAVESVIDGHYAQQEDELEHEPHLQETIARFRAEEREHHDTALEHGAEQAPLYRFLKTVIQYQTKAAIWLSTRV